MNRKLKHLKFEAGYFAWQVQSLRQKQYLSLHRLAEIVHVNSQTLWRIERETCEPRAHDFMQLCAWMNKSPFDFFTVIPESEIEIQKTKK